MGIGENRALKRYKLFNERYSFSSRTKPCIFLSHKSVDKDIVMKIGDYIMKAGIDIYLDVNDLELQRADKMGDDKAVTQCIQKGIEESTHVMCLLSPKTVESWWVPYEIGYGEKANKEISSLKLKPLLESGIPSYIKIRKCITNLQSLNAYLKEVWISYAKYSLKVFDYDKMYEYSQYNEAAIIKESCYYHPLKDYIDC